MNEIFVIKNGVGQYVLTVKNHIIQVEETPIEAKGFRTELSAKGYVEGLIDLFPAQIFTIEKYYTR